MTASKTEKQQRRKIMEAKHQLRQKQQNRKKRDNMLAIVAASATLLLALGLQTLVFAHNPTHQEVTAAEKGLEAKSSAPSTPTPGVTLPGLPDPSLASGRTLSGSLVINGHGLGVELDGTHASRAASALKALAENSFFTQRPCTRITTGNFAVLQCGATTPKDQNTGPFTWGPVENAPANNVYPAGTIAMARVSNDGNSNSTQFFITYKDTTIPADSAGGYSVVGKVTHGLDAVSTFAEAGVAGGGSDGPPAQPITIDSLTLQ